MAMAYFPVKYKDELVYSVLARFYEGSGYTAYIYCADDLFEDKKARPSIEFINRLKPEVLSLLCGGSPIEEIVERHTMFPYYSRFMESGRRNRAFGALCAMEGNYSYLMAIPKTGGGMGRMLRYCPICTENDKMVYGETYWHRSHQMAGVDVCPIHGCRLCKSGVPISAKASPRLVTAQGEADLGAGVQYPSTRERELSEYVAAVFEAVVDLGNEVPIGDFLASRLEGSKYLSVRGEQRNLELLYQDFKDYYGEMEKHAIEEPWQIQKIFMGQRTNTYEVCQLGMFLGIPAWELAAFSEAPKKQATAFDMTVAKMHGMGMGYNKIARELGVSSKTVRDSGKRRIERRNSHKKHSSAGVKPMDWERIDNETLPVVREAVENLMLQTDARPRRINPNSVCRMLGIPYKRLEKMPLCRNEVLVNGETQEHFWARETIWALDVIKKKGCELNWTAVRRLTNMKKRDFERCIPDLENISTQEIFKEIMEKIVL